ncbi:MAG: ROK family protein, partial [Micromonosporaceae bacterium]
AAGGEAPQPGGEPEPRVAARVTAAEVVARAGAGEVAASQVWQQTIDALADGLLTAITLYDPELIVLGGGLGDAGDALLQPLAEALDARRSFETLPRLARAALGDQAGCLGAALLAADAAATTGPAPGPNPASATSEGARS